MKCTLLALFLTALLTACASSYRPVIDPQTSAKPERYETDLADCQRLASQGPGAGTGAAVGAGAGYLLGQVLARAMGARGSANEVGRGAAVMGAVSGAATGGATEIEAVRTCMARRGYSVIR